LAFDGGAIVCKIYLNVDGFTKPAEQVKANMSGIQQKFVSFGVATKELGQNLTQVGRQIGQVGKNLTFLGAGITAPLVAAFMSAEKYSNGVRLEIEKLNRIFLTLRLSIAEALLPTMQKISNILGDFVQRWLALSPALRENILRITFMGGAFLMLGGTITLLIGKIIALVGGVLKLSGAFLTFIALNPEIALIAAGVIALTVAMWKWGEVSTPVLNSVETGVLMVAIGYEKLTKAMVTMMETSARFWGNTKAADYLQGQADALQRSIDSMQAGLNKMAETGKGSLSKGFDNLKSSVGELIGLFDNLGKKTIDFPEIMKATKTFAEGFSDGLKANIQNLTDFGTMATGIVDRTVSGMTSAFSSFFYRGLTGQLDDMKNAFAEFGNYVLRIITDVIAQLLVGLAIKSLFGGGGGGLFGWIGNLFGAGGGGETFSSMAPMTSSFMGMQEGADPVPYTGIFRLHEGEKVTPRHSSDMAEKTNLTIYNLITTQTIAAAMQSKEGAGVIVNTINENSLRNGVVRREVKRR
jgi:hypothetical protein